MLLGLRRPYLFTLGYIYVDLVSPQRLSYYLLNSVPVSLIFFAAALGGWALADDKRDLRIAPRQILLAMLLGWCAYTTATAEVGWTIASEKWGWVWKSLVFAIFLPFTLRTKLRLEALLLFMALCAASIIIVGGIKTLFSGGGYGSLNLMVDSNSGLYEGSTISTVAIALVPLILFLMRFGTVFPPDWRVRLFGGALIFACLLIPIGTEARTGLVCIAVLALLMLRQSRRRFLYLGATAAAGLIAVPLLPSSFTSRMDTIQNYQADNSASTRIAVWKWTWGYVRDHPLGGGFEVYRTNRLSFDVVRTQSAGNTEKVDATQSVQAGRAFHSSYFELLGEQGFPGFLLWIAINIAGLVRMEVVRRRYGKADAGEAWVAPLATALQHAQLIYLVGGAFVGIAFQSFLYMVLAGQIGLDTLLAARRRKASPPRFARLRPAPASGGAPG